MISTKVVMVMGEALLYQEVKMAGREGHLNAVKFLPTIKQSRNAQPGKGDDMKFRTFSKPLTLPSLELMYADLDQVSTLFSKKQLNKKVCDWFTSWRPWQQRILMCSLSEKCSKSQLQTLFTTLEPVFHRDFTAKLRGSYPTSLIQPRLIHTISSVLSESERKRYNNLEESELKTTVDIPDNLTENRIEGLQELLYHEADDKSSYACKHDYDTCFNEVVVEEGVVFEDFPNSDEAPSVNFGIAPSTALQFDQSQLHEHAPPFSRKVSTPNFFSSSDVTKLGRMKSIVRAGDKDHIYGKHPASFKHSKWWEGHKGSRLLKPRRSKLSKYFKTQLNQINKWLDEWPSHERVDMLAEIVKCCVPDCLNFFALCLSQRLRDETGLNCVPDQTLLQIFSYLDVQSLCRSSQVCRRWRYLAQDGGLWRGRIENLGAAEGLKNITKKIESLGEGQDVDWKQAYREVRHYYKELDNVKLQPQKEKKKEKSKEKKVQLSDLKPKSKKETQTTGELERVASTKTVEIPVQSALVDMGPAQSPTTTDQRSQTGDFEPKSEDQNDLTGGNLKMLARSLRALMRENENDKDEDVALDVRPALIQAANVLQEDHADHPDRSRFCYLSLAVQGVLAIKRVRKLQGHMDVVLCLQYDRRRVVTGSSDRTIRMWDVRSGRSIRKMKGHKGGIRCLQFDNEKIISGSWDMTIMVWHIVKFTRLKVLYGHKGCVSCLRFDDNHLVSGSHDATIRVWSTKTWECVKIIAGHDGAVMCLEFDSPFVLSGSADKTIKLWQIETGECLNSLIGHKDAVVSMKVIGSLILSGSADGMILFWDLDTGQCEAAIQGHEGPVNSITYSNDHFFSCGGDNLIKEWDVSTCTCLRTLQGHKGPVQCVMASPNRIVSCSSDGSVRVWDLVTQDSAQNNGKNVSVGENTIEAKTINKEDGSEIF